MDITISRNGPISVANVSGQFDLGDEEQLAAQLQPLVAEPNSRLAIELSKLKQINSLGLSELINVVIRSRMNRSRVVLVAPSPFVMGVFEVTHLDRWFEFVDDLDAATASLQD